jgi:hypothetical protein
MFDTSRAGTPWVTRGLRNEVEEALQSIGLDNVKVSAEGNTVFLRGAIPMDRKAELEEVLEPFKESSRAGCLVYHTYVTEEPSGKDLLHLSPFHMP